MRRQVAAMVKKLGREKVAYATAYARLLQAAIAAQEGDVDRQESTLRQALIAATEAGMAFEESAARHHLGHLVGGDEGAGLLAQSNDWMQHHEIENPARMVQVAAPGFDRGE